MAKDGNGEASKNDSGAGFTSQARKRRGGRKQALKVQLCHAMDEMAGGMRQAVELCMRNGVLKLDEPAEEIRNEGVIS